MDSASAISRGSLVWSFISVGFLLALCLLLALPSAAASTRILVIGDSLSAAHGIDREAGWVALLRERLARKGHQATVVNGSISGDTTRAGLSRLPAALEEHDPEIVIIELGGNDGLRGLPPQETRRNLGRMIELVRESGARALLLGVRLPSNYGAAFIERFTAVFREVASDYDVPLVPEFLRGVGGTPELMQADGIHPNAAAQERMLDNVWPKLEPLIADR